jgi:hypothetical protein
MIRDDDLSRLLGAVRADAEPALWTRARARIEARPRAGVGGWWAWVMRPAALGASLAVFAGAVAVSAALVTTAPRALTDGSYESLTEALVADLNGSAAAAMPTPATPPAATPDSGGAR